MNVKIFTPIGFFDTYKKRSKIIVTGSSRLEIYKKGGDSLMGRYFTYRLHQLSLAELGHTKTLKKKIRQPSNDKDNNLNRLLKNGGFPEPYLKNDPRFLNRWKRSRHDQLFQEDIRGF